MYISSCGNDVLHDPLAVDKILDQCKKASAKRQVSLFVASQRTSTAFVQLIALITMH